MTVRNPYDDAILLALIAILQTDVDDILEDTDAIREVTDAEPVLEETGGTLTTDGNVQVLYINNAPAGVFRPVCLKLDFSNHTAGETIAVDVEYRIAPGGAFVLQDSTTFAGVPAALLVNIDLEPNRYGIMVNIQRTAGTNRVYDWEVFYEEAP